jgi:hypothetical protein
MTDVRDGAGANTWPAIVHHARPWDFWHGVAMSFLGAFTLLCLLGVGDNRLFYVGVFVGEGADWVRNRPHC